MCPLHLRDWMTCGTMGSVSSIVPGNTLNNKHCKASEYRLKKGTTNRKSGGCSLDGLLNCGFTQGSSSPIRPPKCLSHSRSGRSEDFFYIKVNHKPRSVYHTQGTMQEHEGGRSRDSEADGKQQKKLFFMPGSVNEMTTADKPSVRSAAFKPGIARLSKEMEHSSLDSFLSPREKTRTPDIRNNTLLGTLSDSGRNSMSSLPTHSTSGSLNASTGPVSSSDGSSAPASSLNKAEHTFSPWVSGSSSNTDSGFRAALKSEGLASKANGDGGSPFSSDEPGHRSENVGGIRSPITTDESLIEHLEQRLLERETELQELQVSFVEKEADTCQQFDGRQNYCAVKMEELNQRCSGKLQQAAQTTTKSQQALQLQVNQLQEDKERLQEDVARLSREKDLAELRLRCCETESNRLAPSLEDVQWEVCQKTGEISLLKKQLKDCQVDVSHKLNEIVSLRATLKEITAKTGTLEKQNKEQGDKLYTRTREVEVCQNELQRKKNEADLLREKVVKLEMEMEKLKRDLTVAEEQRLQQGLQLEVYAHTRALERLTQSLESPVKEQEDQASDSAESLLKKVEALKKELTEEKDAKEKLENRFERERLTWNKEKEKVIKYQKQLQINYLQMHKKNQDLEKILKGLTAELESRAKLGLDINYSSGLQTYDDVIATEI